MAEAAFKLSQPLYWYLDHEPSLERQEAMIQAALAEPLVYFCPNGKQEEFIDAVAYSTEQSKIPVILFTAANGVGKTTISLHILANIIYGVQNGWFDKGIFRHYPFPKLAWYITTRSAIENVIVRQITELFPPGTYTFDKRGKPYVSAVHFENGWELVFFTQDQETSQMESATVGLIVGDEPFTEDIWKALKSRRRMGCLIMLPMTPLDVEPFVIDEVEKYAKEKRAGYFRITASVYDACKRRGIRGHLDPEIIDEMVAGYSEEEKQARAYGDFMYFAERIYAVLDPMRHWVNPEDYPLSNTGQNLCVCDPHDGRPCAVGWMHTYPIVHSKEYQQLIAQGKAKQQVRRIIFAEHPVDQSVPFWEQKDVRDLGEQVADWIALEQYLLAEHGAVIHRRILDRHFGWQRRNSTTIANTFMEEGRKRGVSMVFTPSYTAKDEGGEIAYGHNKVREALQDLEDGKPGLVIWRNCWHTWNGLTHYIRKRRRNSDTDRAVGETKIVPKYTDFPDMVRYGCCAEVWFEDDGEQIRESRNTKAVENGTRDPFLSLRKMLPI